MNIFDEITMARQAGASDLHLVRGLPPRCRVDGALRDLEERPLFWHYPHYGNQGGEPSSIIRKGAWKLIWYHETGEYELYNLEEDLGETKSVASLYPEKCAELKSELHAWLDRTGAVMPVQDPLYSEEKEAAYRKRSNAGILERQEKLRLDMMEKDWSPDPSWWGSSFLAE